MKEVDLLASTKSFALRVIKLVDALPNSLAGQTIGRQLIRCGTSVSSNYRAACRGRSKAEFIAKLGILEEDADESCHWLEIIIEPGLLKQHLVEDLLREGNELTAIMAASKRTARSRTQSMAIRKS